MLWGSTSLSFSLGPVVKSHFHRQSAVVEHIVHGRRRGSSVCTASLISEACFLFSKFIACSLSRHTMHIILLCSCVHEVSQSQFLQGSKVTSQSHFRHSCIILSSSTPFFFSNRRPWATPRREDTMQTHQHIFCFFLYFPIWFIICFVLTFPIRLNSNYFYHYCNLIACLFRSALSLHADY